MKILITGARGYVGKYLQKELQDCGMPYLATGRQEFDLADYEGMCTYLKEQEVTHIIHLAGAVETSESKLLFDGNISGLYNLLLACSQCAVEHFTFVSGNNVYDSKGGQNHSVEEACAPERENLYGLSKYVGELLVNDFCSKRDIACAMVRISDIYGPGQKYGNLLKAIVNSVQEGRSLKKYGSGSRKRDYIYVTDVAKGLSFIAVKGLTGAMNLGTGVGTSVAQLIDIAAELSNGACEIETVAVETEDTSSIVLDVEPLKAAGFSATVTVYEGLKKCILEGNNENT